MPSPVAHQTAPLALDSPSAKENIAEPLRTFRPFPRLPAELRFDIWDFVFAEQCPDITVMKEESWKAHTKLRYTAKNPAPNLLWINYESRSVMFSKAFPLIIEGNFTRYIPVSIKYGTLVLQFNFLKIRKFEKGMDRISNAISKETRNRIKNLGAEGRHCFRAKLGFVKPDFMTETWPHTSGSHIQGWNAAVKTALRTTQYQDNVKIPEIKLMSWLLKVERRKDISMRHRKMM